MIRNAGGKASLNSKYFRRISNHESPLGRVLNHSSFQIFRPVLATTLFAGRPPSRNGANGGPFALRPRVLCREPKCAAEPLRRGEGCRAKGRPRYAGCGPHSGPKKADFDADNPPWNSTAHKKYSSLLATVC